MHAGSILAAIDPSEAADLGCLGVALAQRFGFIPYLARLPQTTDIAKPLMTCTFE